MNFHPESNRDVRILHGKMRHCSLHLINGWFQQAERKSLERYKLKVWALFYINMYFTYPINYLYLFYSRTKWGFYRFGLVRWEWNKLTSEELHSCGKNWNIDYAVYVACYLGIFNTLYRISNGLHIIIINKKCII